MIRCQALRCGCASWQIGGVMKTTRRQFFYLAAGGAALAAGGAGLAKRSRTFTRRSHALGAETALTVWHDHARAAEEALTKAFQAIDSVEDVMSLYRPNSQLCRLNRRGELGAPHPDLVHVLRYAEGLSQSSGGAFDVTVQPLWRRRQKQRGARPGKGVRECVNWRDVEVSEGRIHFLRPGMEATLNGIAQGFAADRVREVLAGFGIRHALIDTGEIAAVGNRQGKGPWRVGVQHPRQADAYLCLTGLSERCLATSGDYETALDTAFAEHHLIDPRTGTSPKELSSVSVAARTAMEADALSTAAFVLGLERGMELIAQTPGADALMVRKQDGQWFASQGFPQLRTA